MELGQAIQANVTYVWSRGREGAGVVKLFNLLLRL